MLLRRGKLGSLASWGNEDGILREDLRVLDVMFNVRNGLGWIWGVQALDSRLCSIVRKN
jgi:hypothetical protein